MSRLGDNGGPAFPIVHGHFVESLGLSLRDYFAAKALQGILAFSGDGFTAVTGSPEQFSKAAYTYADAMLAAREAKP